MDFNEVRTTKTKFIAHDVFRILKTICKKKAK